MRAVRERVCSSTTNEWTHEEGTLDASLERYEQGTDIEMWIGDSCNETTSNLRDCEDSLPKRLRSCKDTLSRPHETLNIPIASGCMANTINKWRENLG